MVVKIKSVLYENQDNGYKVAKAQIIEGTNEIPSFVPCTYNQVVMVGYFTTNSNVHMEVDGEWIKNKYGYQFEVERFKEIIPKTKEGIIAYLSSGLIKGVGESTAKKIVDTFGLKTLDIFDNEPERLLTLKGIGRNKLEKIVECYQNSKNVQNIINVLAPHGISTNKCIKIYQKFGNASMDIIYKDTFQLCEIDGFGFITVDEIAQKTAYSPTDSKRIQAAITFVLKDAGMTGGHLCLNQQELICISYILLNRLNVSLKKLLKYIEKNGVSNLKAFVSENNRNEIVPIGLIVKQLKNMAMQKELLGDNGFAYLPEIYEQENTIAKDVAYRILENKPLSVNDTKISQFIFKLEKKNNIKLAAKQIEAIFTGVKNNFSIITGGPGTGKTTVLKFILEVCQELLDIKSEEITLLAPTGRAASRMGESVSGMYESSTIHSKLRISTDTESENENIEKLKSKIVVVDECSMVDSFIMKKLLVSIPFATKIILIGDVEQLPSVGAGNVLFELIKSKVVPTTRLTAIYRQEGTSPIVINADLIRKGISQLQYDNDFKFIQVPDISAFDENDPDRGDKIQSIVSDKVVDEFLNELNSNDLEEIQVLCPLKKKGYKAGATELNKVLQNHINPPSALKKEIKKGDNIFRVGDKVMQTKNNYDMCWVKDNESGVGIFNGEVGFIKDIVDDDILVDYDGKIATYNVTQLSEQLTLAYAISIHKSQGSEYKTVIIPIITSFAVMLKRNLIYTGITRAKNKVILVGQQKAINLAIHNNSIAKRNTQLSDRIVDIINKNA